MHFFPFFLTQDESFKMAHKRMENSVFDAHFQATIGEVAMTVHLEWVVDLKRLSGLVQISGFNLILFLFRYFWLFLGPFWANGYSGKFLSTCLVTLFKHCLAIFVLFKVMINFENWLFWKVFVDFWANLSGNTFLLFGQTAFFLALLCFINDFWTVLSYFWKIG